MSTKKDNTKDLLIFVASMGLKETQDQLKALEIGNIDVKVIIDVINNLDIIINSLQNSIDD